MRAAILIRRPHFAKIVLENMQVLLLNGNDINSVLGYAVWGDVGKMVDTPKGTRFIPDSEDMEYTFTPYRTTGKEMIVYEPTLKEND